MKRNNRYIAMGFVFASMLSCTNDAPEMEQTDEASRIYLSAGIGEVVSSRTPYELTAPTTEHPLNVSVWATTDNTGKYPDSGLNGSTGTVAIHTKAHFQSGTPQLLGDAIYPKADGQAAKTVYFVGFHPQSTSWTASNENQSATFTFTGKEDVMFAPQISGAYNTAFDASPQFNFYHLLTWLRIEMVADKDENDILKKEAIAEAWGKIKELTISSNSQVTVNSLGQTYADANETKNELVDNLTFSGETNMNFYHTGTDTSFPEDAGGYAIPTALTEVAYVMCAPVQGVYQYTVDAVDVKKPEYTLHLKTEKRELDIPIDLKIAADVDKETSYFKGSTRGHQFKILLNFKMGNVISVSAEISLGANADWYTHGTGTGNIKEDHIKENR